MGIALLSQAPAAFAEARITPSTVDFGVQPQGVQGAPAVVELVNTGRNPLRVYRTVVNSGPTNADFVVAKDGCTGVTLEPGGRCPLEVAFKPTGVGPTSQTLGVDVSGPDYRTFGERAAVVTLDGVGIADGGVPPAPATPETGQAGLGPSPLPIGLVIPIAGVAAIGLGFMALASTARPRAARLD